MIEYALQDIDENEYELSGSSITEPAKSSVTFPSDRFRFDSKIVENSALPGAVKLGVTRLKSSNTRLQLIRSFPLDTDYRAAENEFIKWLEKAVYLIDKTNDRRTLINIEDINIKYDKGAHKLSSDISASLRLITPYWEDVTQQSQDEPLSVTVNEIAITNNGFLPVCPIFTFTASVAVSQIEAFIDETRTGIKINDSIFGTSTYLTMILDCEKGTLKIGDLNRIASIADGTGFFNFPVGSSTLKIVPNAACDVNIKWRERDYV
ncbi:MAG: phage distal tail protein [Candidatus Heimdallarchaeaceae archaeon]